MAEKNALILLDFKIHRLFSFSGGFPHHHVGMFVPIISSKQQSNANGMEKMILLLIFCSFAAPAIGQEAHRLAASDTLALKKPVPFVVKKILQDYLQAHLEYPRLALENCIEGEVVLLLRFSEQGGVESAKILKGIGFGCDEEALRLAMLFSQPAEVPVASSLKLNIRFRLR